MKASTSASKASPDLMAGLRRIAKRTLASAGPRYAPALDPNAPNLEIEALQRAASALSVGTDLRARAAELEGLVAAAYDRDSRDVDQLFARRAVNLPRLCDDLRLLSSAPLCSDVRRQTLQLGRHVRIVRELLGDAQRDAYEELRALDEQARESESEDEKRQRSNQRELIRFRIERLQRLDEPLSDIRGFVEGSEGRLLARSNSILLLGEWKATDCNSCVRFCRVRCGWWLKRTRCSVGCCRRSRSSGGTACCCW